MLDKFNKAFNLILEELDEKFWEERKMWGKDKGDYPPEQAAEDFIKKYDLKLNESTGRYDCDGDMVEIKDPKERYYDGWQIPVPLGVVKGSFTNMHYFDSDWGWGHGVSSYHSCVFKSFKNFPTRVEGNFVCSVSNRFRAETLEGVPEYVGGDCIIDGARYLKTMMGAPKHVGGNFACSHCYNLTNCVGAPQDIGEGVDLTWNYRLISLEGLPKIINGDLICAKCKSLSTLEGAPEKVTGKIVLAGLSKGEINEYKKKVTGKGLREQQKLRGMHRSGGTAAPRGVNVLSHDDRYKRFSSKDVPKGEHFWKEKIRGESREVRRHRRVVK